MIKNIDVKMATASTAAAIAAMRKNHTNLFSLRQKYIYLNGFVMANSNVGVFVFYTRDTNLRSIRSPFIYDVIVLILAADFNFSTHSTTAIYR